MKRLIRPITAASDYRHFDGLDLSELKDSYPYVYLNYFEDTDTSDIVQVFIPKSPEECKFIAFEDTDGIYWLWDPNGSEGPGYYEVSFDELYQLMF